MKIFKSSMNLDLEENGIDAFVFYLMNYAKENKFESKNGIIEGITPDLEEWKVEFEGNKILVESNGWKKLEDVVRLTITSLEITELKNRLEDLEYLIENSNDLQKINNLQEKMKKIKEKIKKLESKEKDLCDLVKYNITYKDAKKNSKVFFEVYNELEKINGKKTINFITGDFFDALDNKVEMIDVYATFTKDLKDNITISDFAFFGIRYNGESKDEYMEKIKNSALFKKFLIDEKDLKEIKNIIKSINESLKKEGSYLDEESIFFKNNYFLIDLKKFNDTKYKIRLVPFKYKKDNIDNLKDVILKSLKTEKFEKLDNKEKFNLDELKDFRVVKTSENLAILMKDNKMYLYDDNTGKMSEPFKRIAMSDKLIYFHYDEDFVFLTDKNLQRLTDNFRFKYLLGIKENPIRGTKVELKPEYVNVKKIERLFFDTNLFNEFKIEREDDKRGNDKENEFTFSSYLYLNLPVQVKKKQKNEKNNKITINKMKM